MVLAQRPGGARQAVVVVLTLLAVAAFVVLLDLRINDPGDRWIGFAEDFDRARGTAVLLVIEALAVVGIILAMALPDPRASPEGWTSMGGVIIGDIVQIGCPGCGTVFEKPLANVDEPHEQAFRCPNCDREGRLNLRLRKKVDMRQETCSNCLQPFTAYRDGAECPYCHTVTGA